MATSRKQSAFFRGEDGMRRTDEEIEHSKQKAEQRRAAGNMPFRFRVPVGETREVIITDDKPDFFMYEHGLKDAEGNWGRLFSGCVKTSDNCPVCESTGKESYYAMFLSCIDLTPFKLRDGTEVEFSRKLLAIKPAQQKKFLRFYAKEGTLRGALFEMTRDGDKDSAIGNDIEFAEFVAEKELETYTRSWKDKEGKKYTEDCSEPFDYEELFEEPTTEKLRALVGGAPTPGSRAQSDRELGGRTRRGSRDDAEERAPRRSTRGKEDNWESPADDTTYDDADDAPSKGREAAGRRTTRRAAEVEDEPPARRGRKSAEDADPEGDGEPETRAPATRRGRAAPAADADDAPPPRRGRAVATEPPEDDPVATRAAARRARR